MSEKRYPVEKERIRSEISYSFLTREELPLLSELIGGMHNEDESILNVRTHDKEYYDWMYFRNPAGPAVVYIGKHNGQIVTSFAVAPKRIQFRGETILCGKCMDMFTHPEYQGLGLNKEVASRVFEDIKGRGFAMVYVCPSHMSYPIFLGKWHYVESFQVNYIVRVLDFAAVLAVTVRPASVGRAAGCAINGARKLLTSLPPPDSRFELRDERAFGAETDALWKRCSGYGVALVRDATYLTWRYLQNPDRYEITKVYAQGELRGILVIKFTRRRGLKVGEFVDCVAAPEDAEVRRTMYRHGLRRFVEEGCAFAQNWAIQDSRWEREMNEVGLKWRRRKMALLLSPGASRKEFYDGSAWYLTPGDGNDL
jgi:GNAT superfamily N-acetyltransferase